jgi:indolepyruvate ferredoxin oxidoreductase beta subunit
MDAQVARFGRSRSQSSPSAAKAAACCGRIVDLAEHGGYLAQATSVPGVARRTGATIYYVELFPRSPPKPRAGNPCSALYAGRRRCRDRLELMEAARAVERGFVTPDKTLLIASTHRVFAMTGGSRLPTAVRIRRHCSPPPVPPRRLVAFDMAALAEPPAA